MRLAGFNNGVANIFFIRIKDYISRYYCCYCGNRLKRRRNFKSYMPGDKGYEVQRIGNSYHRGPYTVTRDAFYCAECNVLFNSEELDYNARIQRTNKKKIVRTLYSSDILNGYVEEFTLLAKEIIALCEDGSDVNAAIKKEFEEMLLCLENEHMIPVINKNGDISSFDLVDQLEDTDLAVKVSIYANKCKKVERIYLKVIKNAL